MAGAPGPPPLRVPTGPEEFDLVGYLAEYLRTTEPKFILILGPVGSGKSTLLQALVPRIEGPKVFVAYHVENPPSPGTESAANPPDIRMLVVNPLHERGAPSDSPRESEPSALLAFSPQGQDVQTSMPPALLEAQRLLSERGPGTIVVDTWDRASEAFFRAQAKGVGSVQTIAAPGSTLAAMRFSLVANPVHIVLAIPSEDGRALMSVADAVTELQEEGRNESRLRVANILKVRGTPPMAREHLYTLERGRFHSLPRLSAEFRPPVGPPDPDPEPTTNSLWPGSSAFARAFGRLRYGGFTAMPLSPTTSDAMPRAIIVTLVLSVLLAEGRVAIIPAPSIRPVSMLDVVRRFLPEDWIRERLRIVSAGGDDPNLGDLASTILPANPRRSRVKGGETEAGATPSQLLFPEMYRFLQDRPATTPALLVASVEGLRSAASTMGTPVNDAMVPVEIGLYGRIPRCHIMGYGSAQDSALAFVRGMADTLIDLETVHGRPVLFGVRPRTSPFLIDWPTPDGRYALIPVS